MLFHCRNSQHPKVNRCCFNYLKNGLLLLQFSPPSAEALCFVSARLPDIFKAMSPVTSTPCKAYIIAASRCLTLYIDSPARKWSENSECTEFSNKTGTSYSALPFSFSQILLKVPDVFHWFGLQITPGILLI